MKYLKIQNDGLLDIRLVALMGGTTKSKDEFKIGQFGTGLKYTLAYLFRNNLDFKIFVGNEEVKVTTETEEIKDEIFEIICINNNRTSITTKMGEDWESWMIIRELWCNALDEGGAYKEVTDTFSPEEGKTQFYIQLDILFKNVLDNWNDYFLHDQIPLSQSKFYDIYPGGDALRLYKQGVLIYEDDSIKALFSYDVKNAYINELREFKGTPQREVSWALSSASEKAAEYFLENITEEYYEGDNMDYDWFQSKWSDSWTKVIGSAKITHRKAVERAEELGINVNKNALIILPECTFKALSKQFPGISNVRIASEAGEFHEQDNFDMQNKVNQAITILETCNYQIHSELQFVYGYFADKNVMAKIVISEKKIYLSNTLAQKSLFDIVATLIEENEHFNTGFSDNTRSFQQHFIDLYTKQLLASNKVEL